MIPELTINGKRVKRIISLIKNCPACKGEGFLYKDRFDLEFEEEVA